MEVQLLEKQMLSNDRLSTSYAILKVTKMQAWRQFSKLDLRKLRSGNEIAASAAGISRRILAGRKWLC